jgi:hypothetical protein
MFRASQGVTIQPRNDGPFALPRQTTKDQWRARVRRLCTNSWCPAGCASLLVTLVMFAPVAQGSTAASLSLDVTFSATGTISVTLPDGTPVGSTSGAPTVIPAGFYTVVLSAPGGCTELPYFDLKGPGNTILDNMDDGELTNNTDNADLLPSDTYTWRNDSNPAVVYTFATSSQVLGTAPAVLASTTGISSGTQSTASSQDVVGSAIIPFRGALIGAVNASGKLSLAYKGNNATSLPAGRYTITVSDASATNGFVLEKSKHPSVSLTGLAFVGKRSTTVNLTAGRWSLTSRPAARTTDSILVS